MIQLNLDKDVVQTILDALDIASSWHKQDTRFKKSEKIIRSQVTEVLKRAESCT